MAHKVTVSGVKKVRITGEYIRLDALLKYASVASTGGEAKMLIQNGEVTAGGDVCLQRGKKIRPGDIVSCRGNVLVIRESREAQNSVHSDHGGHARSAP